MWVGMALQANDIQEVITDGVLLAFWLFAAIFFHLLALRDLKEEIAIERMRAKAEENLHHALGDLFGEYERDVKKHEARREAFTSTFKEVTGKEFTKAKTVSARHKAQIQKRFNEKTGLHADITVHKDGKIEVDITKDKPVIKKASAKKQVAKKAPIKKPVTTKKGNK